MKIVLLESAARTLAGGEIVAEPGVPVDVPSDLAKSLLEQSDVWGHPAKQKEA